MSSEHDDRVIHALAVGASLADLDSAEALALLRAPSVNLRRVAAYHLGLLVSNDEADELIRKELTTVALSDSDSEVRGWAQFGLDTSREHS